MNCPAGVDKTTLECICPSDYAIIEKDTSGQYLKTKECLLCPDGTYPGPDGPVYECKACPEGKTYDTNVSPWVCKCDSKNYITAGDICVPISDSQFVTTNYAVNLAKGLTFTLAEVFIYV